MRLGFEDGSGKEAAELARRAEAAGLCAVTVHGRTKKQLYMGRADYRAIGEVKKAVSIPVIGNGDVTGPEDAARLCAESHCDGIMIGRAGLGNPWIYRNLQNAISGSSEPPYIPTLSERAQTLLKHLDLEVLHLGEKQAALNLRRIVFWYTAGLPNAKPLRVSVCQTYDVGLIRRMLEDFFAALPDQILAPQVPILLAE
jgi:tRNA-dihydrouridine synthase